MSGVIGIIADYSARYSWFHECFDALNKPPNTKRIRKYGANRGAMREAIARETLAGGHEWLFFVDDDQAFHSETLIRLLAHNQPVVSALIFQRGSPFLPTVYANRNDDGSYSPLDISSVGSNNLVKIAGAGTGGLLIRSDVLLQLDDGKPWFRYSEELGEDLYFCNRLAEAGIPLLVDTGCRMGHIAPSGVFPRWNDAEGKWEAEFVWGVGSGISMTRELDYLKGRNV